MAWAQHELNWAEPNLANMCGSLPNNATQLRPGPLTQMCELQDTFARLGEPHTILGARELLGIAVKLLAYRIEHSESTVDQGPIVQLIRNVNEALKWLDGDARLCPPSRSDKTDTGTKARTDRAGSFELFRPADSEQTARFPVATAAKAVPSLDPHTVRKGMCGCRGYAHECSCQAQQNSSLLHHDVGAGRSGRTGEAFRVSSVPMGEGAGLDGKVPQQNPELRRPHEAASAPAPRLFVKPEFNRPWSIQLRRKVDDLSFVLNLLATVTLIGLPLLAPRDNAGTHVREQPGDMMSVRDGSSVARTSPALVVTASQKSYVNEPLPLGMWLNNDSGKETVTIDGLVEGTELSLGTSRGLP
jgi:hypothetical protein